MIDSGDPSMKTEAPPEYNIAHYTPNANRRACHRDQHTMMPMAKMIWIHHNNALGRSYASRALLRRKIAKHGIQY
jgi:hypothetical protein